MNHGSGSTGTIYRPQADAEFYFQEGCFILELSNTDSDPVVSVARARVSAGTATRLHRLKETSERYVILEGSGEITIGDLRESVSAGDVAIIPANCPQRIRNLGSTDLIFLAICSPRFTPACYCNLGSTEGDDR